MSKEQAEMSVINIFALNSVVCLVSITFLLVMGLMSKL